jgi:ferritin-like metal-binding protein YciE
MRSFAQAPGITEAAAMIDTVLNQEKAADRKLSRVSMEHLSVAA